MSDHIEMDDYEAERLVIDAYRESEDFKSKVTEAKKLMREMRSKLHKGPSMPSMPGMSKTLKEGH